MTLDPGLRGKVACGAGAVWLGQLPLVSVSESLRVGVDDLAGTAVVALLLLLLQPSRVGTLPMGDETTECQLQ